MLAWCRQVVSDVNGLEAAARACTDDDLRARTAQYKGRVARGESAEALLPEAFATVREAARRTLGLRHHDVQIMGGAAMHLSMIAEMRTGEGKTLTATLPAYLAALKGQSVHVLTANDYLANRDRTWMQPVYERLGITTGLLEPAARPDPTTRRAQYAADLTYGPWAEFSYDFLRDNLAWDLAETTQRGLGFAIVDEADVVLIEEMRSPAMISGPADDKETRHAAVAVAVGALRPGDDFTSDRTAWTASLTDSGTAKLEDCFGTDDLYAEANGGLAHLVDNAVKARALYEPDREYLVAGDQIVLIDQKSGRPLTSRYGDGMHEALEAKEGLLVRPPSQVIASIVFRDYLRQYEKLTGMTGTAVSEAPIYRDLYGLDVIAIPTNRPVIRVDHQDMLYKTRQGKLAALVADAGKRSAAGQPVLIGAMSAADAEAAAGLLADAGVACELLIARNFEREAQVLAEAGQPGAVTIVVKMAGRGIDIRLGGGSGADYESVADRGGLCVLGTERTGDRRTELHLRGRAGRQGDPGESRFYLSLEDDAVRAMMQHVPKSLLTDGAPFGRLSRELDKRQINLGHTQAQWYQTNVAFDDVLAVQQRPFYAERRTIVAKQDVHAKVLSILDDILRAEVAAASRPGEDPIAVASRLQRLCPVSISPDFIVRNSAEAVLWAVRRAAEEAYQNREAQLGPELMRELERRALLAESDRAWRQHLAATSDLMSSAMIRAAGGTPSLPAYQREAVAHYAAMTDQIRREAIRQIFFAKIRLRPGQS